MKFTCPNDGPQEAESEVRTTTPVRVEHTAEQRKVVKYEASTGDPVVVVDEVLVGNVVPTGAPVERTVCVCPVCGSPIVVDG